MDNVNQGIVFFHSRVCHFFCHWVYFHCGEKINEWKIFGFPVCRMRHYPLYSCIPIFAINDFALSLAAAPMEVLLFLALK